MRSFSLLSLAATVAFSVFSSAAPLSKSTGAAVGAAVGAKINVPRGLVDVDVEDNKILSSRADLPSVPKILNDLTTQLQPVVDKINNLTGASDIVAELTPLVGQVNGIVGTAITDVNNLVGAPVATILASVDGTVQVTVSDVAKLVSEVLTLVVSALGAVLKIVGGDLSKVGSLLSSVGSILAQLVGGLLKVVDGLLSELTPLVGGLVSQLTSLGFSTLGSVLGLVL